MDYVIDKSKLTSDQRIVICLEGSTSAHLRFYDSGIETINLKNIHYANIAIDKDGKDTVEFTINKGNERDYITLSVHSYKNTIDYGNANNDFNIINTGWLTSYINSSTTKGECFPLTKEVLEKSSAYL